MATAPNAKPAPDSAQGARDGFNQPLRPMSRNGVIARALLPLPFGAAILWLLYNRLESLDWTTLLQQIAHTQFLSWGLALSLTALSFSAVAGYDLIAHRTLKTNLPAKRVLASGAAATALGQTLGFGLITGSLVRYRVLKRDGLCLSKAFLTTGLVTGGFFTGWIVLASLALWGLPRQSVLPEWLEATLFWVSTALICGISCILLLKRTAPHRAKSTVKIRTVLSLIFLAAIDCIAAAAVLFVLLPSGTDISFLYVFSAFVIALGCGILSGTPMGMGAFEMTLLLLLPFIPAQELMVGILGFRLVYYVIPALMATIWVSIPRMEVKQAPQALPQEKPSDPLSAMIHEKGCSLAQSKHFTWTTRQHGPFAVSIGDPLTENATLCSTTKIISHYKIKGKCARTLRQKGYLTIPLCLEAVIETANYTVDTPRRRTLRRKLKKAKQASVVCRRAYCLPFETLNAINTEWANQHGGERGYAVGQFSSNLLQKQRVFIASMNDEPVAFITFHIGQDEWLLDLIRYNHKALDGTLYALINAAILQAKDEGVQTVSLDAAPFHLPQNTPGLFAQRLAPKLAEQKTNKGLKQFKATFAPRWRLRYLAAPNTLSLILSAMILAFAVQKCRKPSDVSQGHPLNLKFQTIGR